MKDQCIDAYGNEHTERHVTTEYFIQCRQPDDTWEQCGIPSGDPDFVLERLTQRRRRQPHDEFRIARRTTSVVIEPAIVTPGSPA